MKLVLRIFLCGAFLLVNPLTSPLASPLLAKDIVEADMRRHIDVLASDAFEGRAPGTNGETLTVNYITDAWAKAGLVPAAAPHIAGMQNRWHDPVPLIQRSPSSAKYEFVSKGRPIKFVGDDFMMIGNEPSIQKSNLPIYFAGYGINTGGRVIENVADKAVMILFDSPENAPAEMRSPLARREALLAAGANAVFIVADNPTDWSVMRRQLLSRSIALDRPSPQMRLEGSMSLEFAVAMVTAGGQDWDKLLQRAKTANYVGENLGISLNLNVQTEIRQFASSNIVGKIAGRKPKSGAILFLGHWDHLGICQPPEAADRICNGAIDNASGIAMLTEIARSLSKSKPDRDIYFMATTAEESGLLGAYHFAANAPIPIKDFIIAFNLDTVGIAGPRSPVTIVGRGTTIYDNDIDYVVSKMKRKPDKSLQSNAFVRRQDGWALSQNGIPAVMVGGAFADNERLQKFLGSDYHGPNDEITAQIDLTGAVDDARLHVALGRYFASTRSLKLNTTSR
jgi:Peptidase family M28